MKQFFMLQYLVFILVFKFNIGPSYQDMCEWQENRDLIISKLTPKGQIIAKKILQDLQYLSGSAIQPIYEEVKSDNWKIIDNLFETDFDMLKSLNEFLNYGNASFGLGELIDLCKQEKDTIELLESFKPFNQWPVLKLLNSIRTKFLSVYPSIKAINKLLDQSLYETLKKNEDPEITDAFDKILS